MILDTSAIVAILQDEPESPALRMLSKTIVRSGFRGKLA